VFKVHCVEPWHSSGKLWLEGILKQELALGVGSDGH
jgi:hypothetical protein